MTVESLTQARDELDRLIGTLGRSSAPGAGEARADAADNNPQAAADLAARHLRQGLGEDTWRLLHTAAATFDPEHEFTLADLADLLGVELPTARAWHRSASKVMRRVGVEVLQKEWDSRAHQNRYRLSDSHIQRAILEAGQ